MGTDKFRLQHILFKLSPATVDLESAVQGFLLSLEIGNCSSATIAQNRGMLSRFLWFAEQSGFPSLLKDINAGHIRSFLHYLQTNTQRWGKAGHAPSSKPVKASTVAKYRTVLSGFWNWAVAEELVEMNPVSRVAPPKVERRVVASLTEAEVRKLIDVCRKGKGEHPRRDLAIILLLLDSGLRASEVCNLKLEDCDDLRLKIMGKGRKERWVGISPATAKAIWDYVVKERGESFYQEVFLARGSQPLTRFGLRQMIERRCQEAGLRHVWPHLLRHTFALTFAEAGGPLNALQALLGHSTPAMSMWYGQMASDRAVKAHRAYSPIERLGLRFRDKGKKK